MGMRMPFGKHRGKEIRELPDQYIQWILEQEWLRYPLKRQLEDELEGRMRNSRGSDQRQRPMFPVINPELVGMSEKIIDAGFRTLAKRLHPDVGGCHEQMVMAGRAKDALLSIISSGGAAR
jgi:hypothetical protein